MPALFDRTGLSADEQQLIEEVLDVEPTAVWITVDTRTDDKGRCLIPVVVFAVATGRLEGIDIDQDIADRLCAAYWLEPAPEHRIPIRRLALPTSTADGPSLRSAGPVAA